MQNNISIFKHELFGEMRVLNRNDEPWFVTSDVCRVLDTRTNDAMNSLDADEKGYDTVASLGGSQQTATISEAGLYSLILRSRKPEAKAFKRWVTHEVLPSIRKHGAYMTPGTITEMLQRPENLIHLVERLHEETTKRITAEEKVTELAPSAAKYDKYMDIGQHEGIGTFAKTAWDAGIDIGVGEMFNLFHYKRILCVRGVNRNQPRAEYVRAGYMTTKPVPPEKTEKWGCTPLVTPKGKDYFLPRLRTWLAEYREFKKVGE